MNDIKQLNGLMIELLESNIDLETMKITDRGYEIINEISDWGEQTRIFQEHKEKGKMFNESTTKQVFGYMLDRVVNAPTPLHRDASVLMIMPFVRQKLREQENDELQ